MPDRLQDYLRQVGEQIRWKRARPQLLAELETHLLDQRDDCLSQGMTEEEAQKEAVRQMGDPVLLGQSLDEVHRPKPQWGLVVAALVLAGAGAALRLWLTNGWTEGGYAVADVLFLLCLGAAALVGTYLLDYTWLYRHGKGVSLAALALLWLLGLWMNGFPPSSINGGCCCMWGGCIPSVCRWPLCCGCCPGGAGEGRACWPGSCTWGPCSWGWSCPCRTGN